eukprot:8137249-Pyramimonas_sp.AAC.1
MGGKVDKVTGCTIGRRLWPGWELPSPVKAGPQTYLPGWTFPEDWDYAPVNFPFRSDSFDFSISTDT